MDSEENHQNGYQNGYQNGINEPNSDEVEDDENLSELSQESYSMFE